MAVGTTHLLLMLGAFAAPYLLQMVTALVNKAPVAPVAPSAPVVGPLASSHPMLAQLEPVLLGLLKDVLTKMVTNAVQAPVAAPQSPAVAPKV